MALTPRQAVRCCCAILLTGVSALAQAVPAGSGTAQSSPEARVKTFLNEDLEFDRYVFPPGRFPSVHWKNPAAVEGTVGAFPLNVEFYDRTSARVTRAEAPGRYAAVVRGTTPDGFALVRYVTLFCSSAELDDYSPNVPVAMRDLPEYTIPSSRWQAYRQSLRRFSFGSLLTFPAHDADAAVFLAGLSELDSLAGSMETPRVRDRQWWVTFKGRTNASPLRTVALPLPVQGEEAPVLGEIRRDALGGYRSEEASRLRALGRAWADSAHEPLVLLVARNAEILFHEAFGVTSDGVPMQKSDVCWMASITKLLTGVLVLQFVDRGILDLDTPIDRYIRELPPSALTLRKLLTHTSGLSWAGEWASDWNPSVENQVAQALPYLKVGTSFSYHRAGYALAGKVLERVSGKAVPYLFDELLFRPLEMHASYADNTYGGLYASALDLARLSQMLLNHGRYGKLRFLNEGTWKELIPRPLHVGTGAVDRSWGIGTAPLGGSGLSDSTYGHEAASGAVLRIDPVSGLIVVIARNRVGPRHDQYESFLRRILHAAAGPLKEPARRD